MKGEYMVITGSAKEVEDKLNDLKRNWRFDILGFTATDNTTTALIFATLVNYPPKPRH